MDTDGAFVALEEKLSSTFMASGSFCADRLREAAPRMIIERTLLIHMYLL